MSRSGQAASSDPPISSRPSPPRVASRLPGLDALKGAAIVGVVLIHAAPSDAPNWNDWVVQGLARLAVPAFLMVSGFVHARKETSPQRLAGHALTFLRLHVLWALIYAVLDLVDPLYTFSWSPRSLLLHFGAGHWAGQFFLVVLVQVLLVAALLGGARRFATALAVAAAFAAWLGGTALLLVWHSGWSLPEPLELVARARANPVWLWLAYFVLGGLVARPSLAGGLLRRHAVAGGSLLLAVLLATSNLPPTDSVAWVADFPYPRVSILLGASCLALALPALAPLRAPGPLLAVGKHSFAIYVLNPAVLRLLEAIAGRPEGLAASLGVAAVTLAACWSLAVCMRRWLPGLLP